MGELLKSAILNGAEIVAFGGNNMRRCIRSYHICNYKLFIISALCFASVSLVMYQNCFFVYVM